MLGSSGPRDVCIHAPESESATCVACRGHSDDFDRRLAALEKKVFEEMEPRLADVGLDKAIEAFVLEHVQGNVEQHNSRRVSLHQKRKVHTHADATTFCKQNIVEDGLEQIKGEIKDELRKELIAILKEELRTLVLDTNVNVKQDPQVLSSAVEDDFPVGCRIVACDLEKAKNLNGQYGTVVLEQTAHGRYGVRFDSQPDGELPKSLLPKNLCHVDWLESLAHVGPSSVRAPLCGLRQSCMLDCNGDESDDAWFMSTTSMKNSYSASRRERRRKTRSAAKDSVLQQDTTTAREITIVAQSKNEMSVGESNVASTFQAAERHDEGVASPQSQIDMMRLRTQTQQEKNRSPSRRAARIIRSL